MQNYDILKAFTRKTYVVGSGNFWYEGNAIGDDTKTRYKICHLLLYSVYWLMTILEILAAAFGDYPEDEKRQSVTLAVCHSIVTTKLTLVVINKKFIKTLNRNMARTYKGIQEKPALMAEKYKVLKINFILYCISVYSAALCFVFEGFRRYFEGSHFETIFTYYPKYEDDSVLATSTRIFFTITLFGFMFSMILSVDGLVVFHLIMFKYKFITLRQYLEDLWEDFSKLNKKDEILASEKLCKGLIEGIIMHKELLRLGQEIDNAFGVVIALQLLLTSGSAVTLLLELSLSDQIEFMATLKISLFVIALFLLLGLYMCNAGEITHEASLVAEALFYCGWHECANLPPPHRNPRKLVLLSCAQAQRTLVMKAFKMFELSYGTFLQVVRLTYSVFALVYAQNK